MEEGSTNRRLFLQLIAGIAVVVGVALFLPVFGSVAVKGAQTRSLSNGKQLATACRLYAVDHAGRFPSHLSDLSPEIVQSPDDFRSAIILSSGKDSGLRSDWLYFGAGFTLENEPPLLLASPQATERKDGKGRMRIFFAGDTAGSVGPESVYQTALAKTMQEAQALFEQTPAIASPAK